MAEAEAWVMIPKLDEKKTGCVFEMRPLVLCKDCKYAVLTTTGEAKYCKFWQGDEDGIYGGEPLYLDGDFYCAAGERR